MTKLMTKSYLSDSKKKIEKEFILYQEEWIGKNWLGETLMLQGKSGQYPQCELVVSMVCAGACYDMNETMEYASYNTGAKYCSDCTIYLFTTSNKCPCCSKRLRTKPKKRRK